jgi:spore coat polysaccharide biosynthesis predicted glycosyltransferase SpsG
MARSRSPRVDPERSEVAVHLVAAGGSGQGGGHVSRMLALAEALAARGLGVSVTILGGSLQGEAARRAGKLRLNETPIPDRGIVVADLPNPVEAIGLAPADRLVVFDDRDAFSGTAAIVVQPSQGVWEGPGHGDRVLAGYDYVPLAKHYRELRDDPPSAADRDEEGRHRIVFCLGGSDPALVTERLAPSLLAGPAKDEPEWSISVIVGSGHHLPAAGSTIPVLVDPADLPDRLAAAELAIVGAGTMKFEVACLRVPAILAGVADDQLAVGRAFAATGSAVWLGDGRTLDPAELRRATIRILRDRAARDAMATRAGQTVDGRGAERLADAILELARSA